MRQRRSGPGQLTAAATLRNYAKAYHEKHVEPLRTFTHKQRRLNSIEQQVPAALLDELIDRVTMHKEGCPHGVCALLGSYIRSAYAVHVGSRKRRSNLKTHHIDFVDAEKVFAGPTFTFEGDGFAHESDEAQSPFRRADKSYC